MRVVAILLSILAIAAAFVPTPTGQRSAAALKMGFFDDLFGGAKTASASHILLKGPNASQQCEKLKMDIYKTAMGRGKREDGVSAEALVTAFAKSARAKSTCPSKSKGGSLGSFGPGEMVPEFDAVAFKSQVGVIHGPVETDFGSHLILITERE